MCFNFFYTHFCLQAKEQKIKIDFICKPDNILWLYIRGPTLLQIHSLASLWTNL